MFATFSTYFGTASIPTFPQQHPRLLDSESWKEIRELVSSMRASRNVDAMNAMDRPKRLAMVMPSDARLLQLGEIVKEIRQSSIFQEKMRQMERPSVPGFTFWSLFGY